MLFRGKAGEAEHVADFHVQDARYGGHGGQGGIDLARLDLGDILLGQTGRLGEGACVSLAF